MNLLKAAPHFFSVMALGIRQSAAECSLAPCISRRKLAIPMPAQLSLRPARLTGRVQFDHDGKLE
jgi:hypothetical protein